MSYPLAPRPLDEGYVASKDALGLDNTYTLSVEEQIVEVKTTSDNNAWTLTLPNVSEAVGRFYSIRMTSRNSTDDITVEDNNDEAINWSDLTLNAADDAVLLFSDGKQWYKLANYGSV